MSYTDFDEDDMLSIEDLSEVVKRLTGEHQNLSWEEMACLKLQQTTRSDEYINGYITILSSTDFDEDDMLSVEDLSEVVKRLTGEQKFKAEDMKMIVDNILNECDLDNDGMLSFPEFEHVISKSNDFLNTFGLRFRR